MVKTIIFRNVKEMLNTLGIFAMFGIIFRLTDIDFLGFNASNLFFGLIIFIILIENLNSIQSLTKWIKRKLVKK
jgi:hypothetical protein